ncbi:hypothetical protein AcW1_003386 [Taiwanofungus camphoratus]|nr:hypothetical protein AcW1_003386 [Antrodia cinnamomea]
MSMPFSSGSSFSSLNSSSVPLDPMFRQGNLGGMTPLMSAYEHAYVAFCAGMRQKKM